MTNKRTKKINKFKLTSLVFAVAVIFLGFVPLQKVNADDACTGLETQINNLDQQGILDSGTKVDPLNGLPKVCTVNGLSYRVIQIFFYAAGGIAVVFIMIGGFQYMMGMSTGGDEAIGKAKKTITYALVGLVVIILAGTIVTILYNLVAGGSSGPSSNTTIPGGGTIFNPNSGGSGDTGGSGTPTDPPSAQPITYEVTKTLNRNGKMDFVVFISANTTQIRSLCETTSGVSAELQIDRETQDTKTMTGSVTLRASVPARPEDDYEVTVLVCDNSIDENPNN